MYGSHLHPEADRGDKMGEKCRVYVDLMDLENVYDSVNREPLWKLLRMYGVSRKLLNGNKSV